MEYKIFDTVGGSHLMLKNKKNQLQKFCEENEKLFYELITKKNLALKKIVPKYFGSGEFTKGIDSI
jgi:hypothetical protein